jgi:hypothetical protein
MHERREPIVIVGHSWGGYRAIYVYSWAEKNNIPIDLLITIDPVGNFSNKFEN